MLSGLTPKQKKVYDFILDYYSSKGHSPALKEIADKMGKSIPTIHQYIKALVNKGMITKEKGVSRSIKPVAKRLLSTRPVRKDIHIGIIGHGIVGQAVEYGFSNQKISIYDKYKDSEDLAKVISKSDYIFLCLPTPIKSDESGIDLSIIDSSLKEITKFTDGTDKIIIIKSTVVPGTTEKYINKYKKSLFCFNPEFLTERSFLQDFINSDRIVIGADQALVFRRVSSIYQTIMPNTLIFQTDPTSAEMVKYMANCLLATRVIFANEMHEICEKLNIKYEEVKKMVVADSRINDSHLDITTLRGFGGKCFPKDLLALRAMAKKKKVNTKILDAVWEKNLKIRKVKDWEEIPFAVSKSFGHKS